MVKLDIEFVSQLTFEYDLKYKNFGMVNADEPFDLFYDGTITKLRIDTGGFPETIGMFTLNVINFEMSKYFNKKENLIESIESRSNQIQDSSFGMKEMMHNSDIDFFNKDKIIFLKSVIVHPKYKGMGVLEELIKSIYMTHYTRNSLFILSGKPIQDIEDEVDFLSQLTINVWKNDTDKCNEKSEVNVKDFFSLDTLPLEDEMNKYKLYAKLQTMMLKQYDHTDFFYYENSIDFWEFLTQYSEKFKIPVN